MGLFQMKVPFIKLQMVTKDGFVVPPKTYPESDVDAMTAEQDILDIMKNYPEFDGVGGFATYLMTGRDLNNYYNEGLVFPNTYEYARKLGSAMVQPDFETRIRQEIQNHLGPYYHPFQLFKGYLVQCTQQAHAQDYGYADFVSSDPSSCLGARVYYSNENMIAYHLLWVLVQGVPTPIEAGPMAIGPDAVCYLLMEGDSSGYKKGHSFTNEDFSPEHGDPDFFRTHEIQMIGIPEPMLRKQDIIANYAREIKRARQAFGLPYDGKYIPIEKLNKLMPVFDMDPAENKNAGSSSIHISTPEDQGTVRYTLDGSEPDEHSGMTEASVEFAAAAGRILTAKFFQDSGLPGLSVKLDFTRI